MERTLTLSHPCVSSYKHTFQFKYNLAKKKILQHYLLKRKSHEQLEIKRGLKTCRMAPLRCRLRGIVQTSSRVYNFCLSFAPSRLLLMYSQLYLTGYNHHCHFIDVMRFPLAGRTNFKAFFLQSMDEKFYYHSTILDDNHPIKI